MFPQTLLEIVRCPVCKLGLSGSSLEIESGLITAGCLICESCHQAYPIENGVASMLIDSNMGSSESRVMEWRNKLAMHKSWWRNKKERPIQGQSLKNAWRPSVSFVKKYLRLSAENSNGKRVLDLGCGEGTRREHFSGTSYIGIDPLVLRKTYPFSFFRGMGEYLPFLDGVFSLVISIEVFDHLLDPGRTVKEIIRILEIGGDLLIFVRDKEAENPDLGSRGRDEPLCSVREPDVHLHNFTGHDFISLLQDSFSILEVEREDGYLAVWGWGKK